MKSIIFLFCSISFALSTFNGEAQNAEIFIDVDMSLNVKQVFRLINRQTDYKFIYRHDLIKAAPNIHLKRGIIKAGTLLDKCLSPISFTYNFTGGNTIVVKKKLVESVVGEQTVLVDQNMQYEISGTITDNEGSPLPGANIVEKGTTNGVTADFDGRFSLEIAKENAILIVSYVGFGTKEVALSGKTYISVSLEESAVGMDEVVVVGYGTKKKVNLTGSIGSVNAETLAERPTPNAANLLQGRMTGLEVIQSSGQPGRDNPVIRIRGLGSFGASSNPLILVDGIAGSINNLAPSDIENVVVLKDAASASIYGSRAANGVILVTTKKGKEGPITIEYNSDLGLQNATRLPDFITNSAEYMEMYNIASVRVGQGPQYTQEQIDSYRNATDRTLYPNFDAVDYYFNQATSINHYLSASGGNDKSSYKLGLGYLNQEGILPKHNFERYNAVINVNSKINDALTIGAIFNATYKKIQEPWLTNDNIVLAVYAHNPTYEPFLPDGSGRRSNRAFEGAPTNGVAANAFYNGGINTNEYSINSQVYIDLKILKGLSWQGKAGLNYTNLMSKNHQYNTPNYYYQKLPGEEDFKKDNDGGSLKLGVTDTYNQSLLPTVFSTVNYETILNENHSLGVLLGYEQQSFKYNFISGNRQIFPTINLKELDAGASEGQTVSGSAYEWALRSVFGRVNYSFKNKYLIEGNIRYDGTSRVSSKNRWGAFPSASAGWRISQEDFMDSTSSWLEELKIRASVGKLGNQEIGQYPYQDVLGLTSYPFGSTLQQGVLLTRLTDKNLKWETTTMLDLGLDLAINNGMFGLTFDWFKKNTTDILATQPVPNSLGLSGPITNDGELRNIGWELGLTHKSEIGKVKYSANFLFSTFKNELVSIVTPTKGEREEGLPYNSYYLYEWIGIMQSQEDIDNSPDQVYYTPSPGDLKIKDQNGDNIVDENDRISISPYPDFSYSFGLNAEYKGFNISGFFQGVEGRKLRVYGWGYDPFVQGDPPTTRFRDAWSPENPSNTVPGLYLGSGGRSGYPGIYTYPSTYHLQDASYLRLKNVSLSFSFPNELINKIKLQGLKLYVSGDNLLTFTNYAGADPERISDGRMAQYPQIKTYNMGINIKF
ncbi:TonB-dependent receptor [Arenibacter palladensis]|uniref:SusC/RagA family TonB-linked outer membrane protein n=1 Tax=Arenibacter palladensis TaxID=237373 RepID=UPI002FD28B44